ncbi:MAG: 2-oxoglutarate oxidoreductase [Candidatus Abyssobacteria bacterium SURF_5]|uniref:2-oxoglutarate oxidoreductase n=1 Tax=Abyssobacteria bacterium (strain SURF_5) TaxID=2093360 RepID=A0A3A4NMZ1_ABYX5|nr:MAG: 2-oxoglutarate oxidoreductase [Candidatus Abyssubacteria bacterium SURF_5]
MPQQVFKRPRALSDKPTHFCPGCTHGTAHRLVAEAIDYFGVQERTIGVACVGCAVFMYDYFNVDVIEAPHGRAPAVATGVKRAQPEKIVFTYQGDGDLAAIGTSEIIHTANRGENITVIFVNNTVYGMTGGQMAPTTLLGQQTTTSPYGRDFRTDGYPIRMAEMLATLEGVAYSTRVSLHNPKAVLNAKKAIRKAFEMQVNEMGFSLVEVLSACHTNWRVSPLAGQKKVEEEMIPYFPLGVFKERTGKDFL